MRLMAVLGSGGHTAEMTALLTVLDSRVFHTRIYVAAATDALGSQKAQQIEATFTPGAIETPLIFSIPRSREVGQSYLTSIFTTLIALLAAFRIVLSQKPDLVLVNGPGTCIPICIAAVLFRSFASWKGRIVYVESIARVKSLSLSGRILYHLRMANLFVVQWPHLLKSYRRATYAGRLY